MENYRELDELSMDILRELGNVGAGNAVSSLSQMMGILIEVDVPALRIMKYKDVCDILNKPEELQTGILVEVTGELKGVFLFMLSETFTEAVLNAVLGRSERSLTSLSELEYSLIKELGNIMCGSYINALSQLMEIEMDVSVPELSIDMGGAILSYPMLRWAIVSDDILLIDNMFHMAGLDFRGQILFLPEQEDLGIMLGKIREQCHG